MIPKFQTDKYAKAIIEEPNPDLPLHVSLLKPDGKPRDDLCYMKIFGKDLNLKTKLQKITAISFHFLYYNLHVQGADEDPVKVVQLTEAVASGETLVRKLHRIRNKELVKFIDKDFEGLKDIHVISEATVGIIADTESNLLSHSFLDLLGTAAEVKLAEQLIIDSVLKTYSSVCYPIILMTPKICWDKINIPLHKVCRVLGTYGSNLLKIEMDSGSWIKIEQGPSPGVWEWERVVNIFGPRGNVSMAKSLIQSVISDQPGELSAVYALNEFLSQFKEPSCLELIDNKRYADGESEKRKKQKVGEGGWSNTFLRVKKSDESKRIEGELEKKKKQSEFKVPSWSETFGKVTSCSEESKGSKETEGVKDKEYSGEPEKGKKAEEGGGSGLTEGNENSSDVVMNE